jgi:hypothetical protein
MLCHTIHEEFSEHIVSRNSTDSALEQEGPGLGRREIPGYVQGTLSEFQPRGWQGGACHQRDATNSQLPVADLVDRTTTAAWIDRADQRRPISTDVAVIARTVKVGVNDDEVR